MLAVVVLAFAIRLFFSGFGLSAGRFHDERYALENDERYALENVGEVLRTGILRPTNGYHPSLSWLPQVVILGPAYAADEAFFGGDHLLTDREPYRPSGGQPPVYPFRPLAYRLGRSLQALLGALAVLVTFRIGHRLAGSTAGLVAASLLAVAPVAVRQSSLINEDAMLVLTTGLAVLWALVALASPRPRTYLLAGVGIGLALSSKFNAFPVALPLAAGTLEVGIPWRQKIQLLAIAAAVAVAVFLILNPFLVIEPDLYTSDFGRTMRDYDRKSEAGGTTRLEVLVQPVGAVLENTLLGLLGGAFALGGLVALVIRASRARWPADVAVSAIILGYPLSYAIATRNTNHNNWLPVIPFFCVGAGLLWQSLYPEPGASRRAAARAAWGVTLVVALAPLAWTVRKVALPTTAGVAASIVDHEADAGVVLIQERMDGLVVPNREMAVVTVPYLGWLPLETLRGADAVVFAADRGDRHPVPPTLLDQPWIDEQRTVRPTLFGRRGPPLHVVLIPWRADGQAWIEASPEADGRRRGAWIDGVTAPWISVEVRLPRHETVPPTLLLQGRSAPLHWARSRGGRDTYVSLRVRRPLRQRTRLELLPAAGAEAEGASQWVLVKGWRPAGEEP